MMHFPPVLRAFPSLSATPRAGNEQDSGRPAPSSAAGACEPQGFGPCDPAPTVMPVSAFPYMVKGTSWM